MQYFEKKILKPFFKALLSQRSPFREKTVHEFRSIIEHFLNYEDTRSVFGKMDGR